jgi:hypothetical protein
VVQWENQYVVGLNAMWMPAFTREQGLLVQAAVQDIIDEFVRAYTSRCRAKIPTTGGGNLWKTCLNLVFQFPII